MQRERSQQIPRKKKASLDRNKNEQIDRQEEGINRYLGRKWKGTITYKQKERERETNWLH